MGIINSLRGTHKLLPLLFFTTMLLILPACVEEHTTPPAVDETTITFSVSVPNGVTPSTYGFGKDEEEYLGTVDVLLFNNSGNYVSGPHYGIIDGINKKVTVRIPGTDGNYTMAVFANCRSALNKTFSGSKENVYSNITISESGKWPTTASDNVPTKPFPMWGEASVTVSGGTVSGTVSVSLIRMLARINITNNANNFALTGAHLYNYNTVGRIAPFGWTQGQTVSTTPSLPDNYGKQIGQALSYTGLNIVKGGTYNGEIYTFEANRGTTATPANNPCLVIGGKYDSDINDTFYRIELADATGGILNYYDLLRNHTYNITVSNITGSGATDASVAFSSSSVNIQYAISVCDDSRITYVVAGNDVLGVSQNEFRFDNAVRNENSEDNILVVSSANAWSVDKIVDWNGVAINDWLSLINLSGQPINGVNGNTVSAVKLKLTGTSTMRTGYIHLVSGQIELVVKVVQGS